MECLSGVGEPISRAAMTSKRRGGVRCAVCGGGSLGTANSPLGAVNSPLGAAKSPFGRRLFDGAARRSGGYGRGEAH
eukprot:1617242-Pyramimonas_sp.AAC.1